MGPEREELYVTYPLPAHESDNFRRAFTSDGVLEDLVVGTSEALHTALTDDEGRERGEAKWCSKCHERGHVFYECTKK